MTGPTVVPSSDDALHTMKLIIQIPCFNEAATLSATLADLPRAVPGIDTIETLIIDDGSTDDTVAVAAREGVDHIVRLPRNQGLARAFVAGLEACVARGADIIVNTDADNQYDAADLPALVAPIVRGDAELVIGERPIGDIASFSRLKKLLQRLGSWVVRLASQTDVPDAPSGFRAMSRRAAMQLHVFSEYSYTLETIIQAGRKAMAVTSVPVRTHPPTRPSRLMRGMTQYLWRSASTIVRIVMTYRPLRFFALPATMLFVAGFALGARFLGFYLTGNGEGHVQSLILAALLMGSGFFLGVIGLVADLVAVNRKLLETVDYRLRRLEVRLDAASVPRPSAPAGRVDAPPEEPAS